MSKKTGVCYQCTDRNADCHSVCEKYAQQVKEDAEMRKQIEQAKRGEKDYVAYMKNRTRSRDRKQTATKSFRGKRGIIE